MRRLQKFPEKEKDVDFSAFGATLKNAKILYSPIQMNSIHVIRPYKNGGLWAFDDENVGLKREPFVPSAGIIIDALLRAAKIPHTKANEGFNLLFSSSPFENSVSLFWVKEEFGGNTYALTAFPWIQGWLCPALLKYFPSAPEDLYVSVTQ